MESFIDVRIQIFQSKLLGFYLIHITIYNEDGSKSMYYKEYSLLTGRKFKKKLSFKKLEDLISNCTETKIDMYPLNDITDSSVNPVTAVRYKIRKK